MKNKEYLKKYLSLFLIIIFIGFIIFSLIEYLEYNKYKMYFNYKISAIISVVSEEYNNVSVRDLVKILNSNDINENILKSYGYDIEKDSYINKLDKINMEYSIIKLSIIIIMVIIISYIFIKSHLKSDKEIEKIIKCIEDINHKNYELNFDELSEDKLSILKEEIYKTTIMLKENAENSLIDKINIKNYLEDISHQLKTPLTSINISLDNIRDNPDMDIETKEYFLRQIKRELTNINFLIQNILKLSKFETNTIDFFKEEVEIEEIIKNVLSNVANICDLKNIDIIVNNNCKKKINCDKTWQIEALTNILKNAVEYSNNDSKVIISCSDNNLYTEIKIKDFGQGMDEKDRLNIFKRFYKGKNASKDSIGIGLSLSKVIIESDNGKVMVNSILNEYTEFIIRYY